MFAIVESGSITSMPRGNKGVEINGIKHPASIFTIWSESERNAIGVYTVEIDDTNKKSIANFSIQDNAIDHNDTYHMESLNLTIPNKISGVDEKYLNPREAWEDKDMYDSEADEISSEDLNKFLNDAEKWISSHRIIIKKEESSLNA